MLKRLSRTRRQSESRHRGRQRARHCVRWQDAQGSFDNFNDIKAKQVLSAFAIDTALVLAHIEIDEKSNEIPPCKSCWRTRLGGHVVTCDAMHCQKKPSKPPRANAHLIVQLKDNQPSCVKRSRPPASRPCPCQASRRGCERRNRHEIRAIAVFDATPPSRDGMGALCRRVIQVERAVNASNRDRPLEGLAGNLVLSVQRAVDAKLAADAIRKHWGSRTNPLHA